MLQSKRCSKCGQVKPLSEYRKVKYGWRPECKLCAAAIAREYAHSERGKTIIKLYRQSPTWRESNHRKCKKYDHSEKGRISKKKRDTKYYYSEKGKAAHLRRYNSDSRKTYCREYIASGRLAKVQRECYHRKQEEAGCHSDTREFYPAYRLLKALPEAEVVEI